MLPRLTTLLVLFLVSGPVMAADPAMKARFIDVGQGASTLLEFPIGAILIDTEGQDDTSSVRLGQFLQDFFQRRRDLHQTLNALVISHPHIDHLRGVKAVLGACKVTCFLYNGIIDGSGKSGLRFARSAGRLEAH